MITFEDLQALLSVTEDTCYFPEAQQQFGIHPGTNEVIDQNIPLSTNCIDDALQHAPIQSSTQTQSQTCNFNMFNADQTTLPFTLSQISDTSQLSSNFDDHQSRVLSETNCTSERTASFEEGHGHDYEGRRSYTCYKCHETFQFLSTLRRHQLAHIRSGAKKAKDRKSMRKKQDADVGESGMALHRAIRDKWNALVMDRMSILAFAQQLCKPTGGTV